MRQVRVRDRQREIMLAKTMPAKITGDDQEEAEEEQPMVAALVGQPTAVDAADVHRRKRWPNRLRDSGRVEAPEQDTEAGVPRTRTVDP